MVAQVAGDSRLPAMCHHMMWLPQHVQWTPYGEASYTFRPFRRGVNKGAHLSVLLSGSRARCRHDTQSTQDSGAG